MYETLKTIKDNWGWFLASGIFLLLMGLFAISSSVYTTLFTTAFLGSILLITGLVGAFYAFWAKDWGGFFLQLITALLYAAVGALLLFRPERAAIALTLLMALTFIVSGLAKVIGSLLHRFTGWGWVLVSGLISLLLGGLILNDWPESGLWVIGLFLGIDLVFYGWTWILMSLKARSL